MTELKPCPFCGASDPMLIHSIAECRWRVDCQDCTASVSTAFKDATIDLWNKRTAQNASTLVVVLERIDKLEWDCPCPSCEEDDGSSWTWRGEYSGNTIMMVCKEDGDDRHDIDLPPGVVLAREVEQPPAAPFMPSPEVRAALALLIDAGNLLGAQDGEHFRTAARTVHAWLYGPA